MPRLKSTSRRTRVHRLHRRRNVTAGRSSTNRPLRRVNHHRYSIRVSRPSAQARVQRIWTLGSTSVLRPPQVSAPVEDCVVAEVYPYDSVEGLPSVPLT